MPQANYRFIVAIVLLVTGLFSVENSRCEIGEFQGESQIISNKTVSDGPIVLKDMILVTESTGPNGEKLSAIYEGPSLDIFRNGLLVFRQSFEYYPAMQYYLSAPMLNFSFDSKGRFIFTTTKMAMVFTATSGQYYETDFPLLSSAGRITKMVGDRQVIFDFYSRILHLSPLLKKGMGESYGDTVIDMEDAVDIKSDLNPKNWNKLIFEELAEKMTHFRVRQVTYKDKSKTVADFYNPTLNTLISIDVDEGKVLEIKSR